MVKKLGLGYQKIDACPNDCMLYFKENEKMTQCTICGHDRFKPNKGGVSTKKSTIPFKILRYFPITVVFHFCFRTFKLTPVIN